MAETLVYVAVDQGSSGRGSSSEVEKKFRFDTQGARLHEGKTDIAGTN